MWVIGILLLAFLVISSVLGLIYPISGAWERQSNSNQSIWDRERMILKQIGFIVFGSQTVHGGKQRFFGFAFGRKVWLKRRDYGIPALEQQGFPKEVAKLVQGRVLLKLHLKLSPDKLFLTGDALPYKIEFFEDGSGIKSVSEVSPTPRNYHRAELIPTGSVSQLTSVGKPAYEA